MRISVIIPAYNAESVLEQCVRSLLDQGYEELEVVVVDDGSRDGTFDRAQELAAADARVKVVSKQNGGVSSARNAGLALATGEVVLFVDADDALVPGALQSIARRFSYGGVDCLVFGMVIEPPEATPLTLAHRLAPRNGVYEDDAKCLIFKEHTHPYAFRVAFSRAFLATNDIVWDTALSLGEDEAFLMLAYRLAHRVICSSEQLYVYRMSMESASHKDNASTDVLPKKLDKHLALVASVMRQWQERGLDRSCDRELLDWTLDLLMLDVSRLEPQAQAAFYRKLRPVLIGYFGADFGLGIARAATASCLRSIIKAANGSPVYGPVVGKAALVRFYVATRGVSAVAERALAALHGRGAY